VTPTGAPSDTSAAGDAPPRWREIALLGYTVRVARGIAADAGSIIASVAPAHRYAIVSDETVASLHLEPIRRALGATTGDEAIITATIPAGEHHKTREQWAAVTDLLLARGCGRDTTIVALGGGVVGDLAGFVAATYLRGVPWVQIPTTLLAMVDASVGGKTGVDTAAGKNLVGAFHQPACVIADPALLRTLPERQRRNGLAEVVKHGIIADRAHLEAALHLAQAIVAGDVQSDDVDSLIASSIAIKADVVRRDERESGMRKVLNFGHTIGHAVETASAYSLLHGEAVAIGMVHEARLAESLGVADAGTAAAVEGAVARVGLPTALPLDLDVEAVIAAMGADKKARRSGIELALPVRVGEMAERAGEWSVPAAVGDVRAVLTGGAR
jgi:3-dehydroquinate synthase